MKAWAGLLLVLGVSLPAAFVLTFLTWRFWGWVEGVTGIESLGHSGPAGWCFGLVYALCVGAGVVVFRKRGKHDVPPSSPP